MHSTFTSQVYAGRLNVLCQVIVGIRNSHCHVIVGCCLPTSFSTISSYHRQGAVNFKIGVLFACANQRTDDDMFSNGERGRFAPHGDVWWCFCDAIYAECMSTRRIVVHTKHMRLLSYICIYSHEYTCLVYFFSSFFLACVRAFSSELHTTAAPSATVFLRAPTPMRTYSNKNKRLQCTHAHLHFYTHTLIHTCTHIHMHLEHGSPGFEEFLNLLGTRVSLKGWNGFRGGLDVKSSFVQSK